MVSRLKTCNDLCRELGVCKTFERLLAQSGTPFACLQKHPIDTHPLCYARRGRLELLEHLNNDKRSSRDSSLIITPLSTRVVTNHVATTPSVCGLLSEWLFKQETTNYTASCTTTRTTQTVVLLTEKNYIWGWTGRMTTSWSTTTRRCSSWCPNGSVIDFMQWSFWGDHACGLLVCLHLVSHATPTTVILIGARWP